MILAKPARRAIDRLPEKVAVAIIEFILGPLREDPLRVGKPLQRELAGLFSARVGAYRVLYQISDHAVEVLHVDHRRDVYRPR